MGGLDYARQVGAATIAFSCNPESVLNETAEVTIRPVVGPEVITGSTRLKAGTATKMVLNMVSTAAMVQLGKTYGNLMVDLRASNSKLIDRSRRLVGALTGLSEREAGEMLACATVKSRRRWWPAAVGLDAEQARRRLQSRPSPPGLGRRARWNR